MNAAALRSLPYDPATVEPKFIWDCLLLCRKNVKQTLFVLRFR